MPSFTNRQLLKNGGFLVLILLIGYLYFKYPFYKLSDIWWLFWLWLAGLLILLKFFELYFTKFWNVVRGSEGEDEVFETLDSLPVDYKIFSNLIIEKDRGNVDQVVVGPTGVWVIETKSHDGIISYNGKELTRDGRVFEKNFIKQVWAETFAVQNLLKSKLNFDLKAQPVIVFSGNVKINLSFSKVQGVYIVQKMKLNSLIKNSKTSMPTSFVPAIKNLLNNYLEKS